MAQAPLADTGVGGRILFELERLELADRDRLEVSGRWFGVRWRRFVRPTLTLLGDGERARVLADLDHKPWTAEDGETWTAAFPVDPGGGAVDEVELAVAPDIAISLPAPTPLRTRRNGRNTGGATRRLRPTGTDGTVVAAHAGSASDGAAPPDAQRELEKLRTTRAGTTRAGTTRARAARAPSVRAHPRLNAPHHAPAAHVGVRALARTSASKPLPRASASKPLPRTSASEPLPRASASEPLPRMSASVPLPPTPSPAPHALRSTLHVGDVSPRSPWLTRVIALIVLLITVAAIVIIVHSP